MYEFNRATVQSVGTENVESWFQEGLYTMDLVPMEGVSPGPGQRWSCCYCFLTLEYSPRICFHGLRDVRCTPLVFLSLIYGSVTLAMWKKMTPFYEAIAAIANHRNKNWKWRKEVIIFTVYRNNLSYNWIKIL